MWVAGWAVSRAELEQGRGCGRAPSASSGCAVGPGLLHGEHHKRKVIFLWKKTQIPWNRNIGDGNLCINQQKKKLFYRRHSTTNLYYLADKRCLFDFLKLATGTKIFICKLCRCKGNVILLEGCMLLWRWKCSFRSAFVFEEDSKDSDTGHNSEHLSITKLCGVFPSGLINSKN